MYDSLLDELEDDVVSNPPEVEELADKVVDAEEADADLLVDDADTAVIADADVETEAESEVEASGEGEDVLIEQVENWSDDPVRMYLTQMGEIPLLTRAQEIYLARQIETTRAQFRAKLLECEYVGTSTLAWTSFLGPHGRRRRCTATCSTRWTRTLFVLLAGRTACLATQRTRRRERGDGRIQVRQTIFHRRLHIRVQ